MTDSDNTYNIVPINAKRADGKLVKADAVQEMHEVVEAHRNAVNAFDVALSNEAEILLVFKRSGHPNVVQLRIVPDEHPEMAANARTHFMALHKEMVDDLQAAADRLGLELAEATEVKH